MSDSARTIDRTWKELCPDGAIRYYEGNDPDGFAAEIKAEFGFDPREPHPEVVGGWGEWLELDARAGKRAGERFQSFPFFCPPEHIDAIYGADERWPVGS